jgi:integrase/recombinase XerD
VRAFLQYVEEERQCTSATRNQRLAAIRALAGFVAEHSPEHIAWCGEIRRIPFKKTVQPGVPYLEKPEMDALLRAPDRDTDQGRRDYALLLFGSASPTALRSGGSSSSVFGASCWRSDRAMCGSGRL